MKKPYFLIATCIGFLFFACSERKENTVAYTKSPAGENASLPHLAEAEDGSVYLSWIEQGPDKEITLKYSSWEGNSWAHAAEIISGSNWFVNWADFPSLMVNGDQMAAHWLQKSDLGTYDYDVRMTMSSNGGKEWQEPFIVHNDGIAAEHGFASMLPMANDQTFITWLDGRYTKTEGGAMSLRAAIFDKDGNAIDRWELDDRICDCCQTGTAMTSNGPIVIYRDRSENEIRDMSVTRWVNGAWTAPTPIAIDLWEIAGCPVNGPQITAKDNAVAAAWFTAANGTAKVKIAFSQDAGATFSEPILVSEGNTLGRVGITSLSDGNIAVSWMDSEDEMASIMVAKYNTSGILLKKLKVAETSMERSSGFPVITANENEIIMAWTEAGEKSKVLTTSINL